MTSKFSKGDILVINYMTNRKKERTKLLNKANDLKHHKIKKTIATLMTQSLQGSEKPHQREVCNHLYPAYNHNHVHECCEGRGIKGEDNHLHKVGQFIQQTVELTRCKLKQTFIRDRAYHIFKCDFKNKE